MSTLILPYHNALKGNQHWTHLDTSPEKRTQSDTFSGDNFIFIHREDNSLITTFLISHR